MNTIIKAYIFDIYEDKYVPEFIDLSWCDSSNIEGIIEFIINVYKIDSFDLIYTFWDYDNYVKIFSDNSIYN